MWSVALLLFLKPDCDISRTSRGDHGAEVDSVRSLRFLPKPEQDPESDFE